MQAPRKLGAKQAANALGVSIRTLAAWRQKKYGPPYFQLSANLVWYNEEDLYRWLNEKRVECDGA